jgi:hypothetical protein
MIVLALPGHLTDRVASGLVLQLSQSMAFLAGNSPSWTEMVPSTGSKKGDAFAVLKEPLKVKKKMPRIAYWRDMLGGEGDR